MFRPSLRLEGPLALDDGLSEQEVFAELQELAGRNVSAEDEVTFLGAGMYDTMCRRWSTRSSPARSS